ncbi:MAG: alkaline phosphatase family protein [Acidimicrobiia bacterium]
MPVSWRVRCWSALTAMTALAVLAGVVAPGPAVAEVDSRETRYVVLVDWDGFDPDFLSRAPTPNLDALAARGTLAVARSVFPSVSNPARASMATGAFPEDHGNFAYYYDAQASRAVGQTRFLAVETLAEAVASEGGRVASVQWYIVHGHGTSYGDPAHLYVAPGGACARRIDVAVDILRKRPVNSGGDTVRVPVIPDLLAVYCDDLDALAHREGTESPGIGPLLAEMDRQLGRIVETIRQVGIEERATIVLTSDHGLTSWDRTLLPQVLVALAVAGYRAEFVPVGGFASPGTEVIIVPNGVRTGNIALFGRAATSQGRVEVERALEQLPQVARVLNGDDLAELRAATRHVDLVAEAEPPWGFSLSTPGQAQGAHGSTLELEVPLLLSGAGVRKGQGMPGTPRIIDIAPTIAALLGFRPPAGSQGLNLL